MGATVSTYTLRWSERGRRDSATWPAKDVLASAEVRRFLQRLVEGMVLSVDALDIVPPSVPGAREKAAVIELLRRHRAPAPVIVRGAVFRVLRLDEHESDILVDAMHAPNQKFVLVDLTNDNYESALEVLVAPEQEKWVGSVATGICDAYFNREYRPFAIAAAARPDVFVGFAMYTPRSPLARPPGNIALHKFLIGAFFQGRGYARAALTATITRARTDNPEAINFWLSANEDNTVAVAFYVKFGFKMQQEGTPNVLLGCYTLNKQSNV
jgi:diamine N-acetyltransferase